MKKLYLDLELTPHLAWVYEKYETNVLAWNKFSVLMSYAYQWEGQKTIHCVALPDFPLYKEDSKDDKSLVTSLWNLLHQPSIVIGHNINAFDLKKSNTHFLKHRLPPPRNRYVTIDTLVHARKIGKFPSNSLEDLGIYLGIGKKEGHHSHLWERCFLEKDMGAWRLMKEYNKRDIELTREVYKRLEPYMSRPAGLYVLNDGKCPRCESEHLIKRGIAYSAALGGLVQAYSCTGCGMRIKGEKKL